jgi:carbamoyltransferase
MKVLGIWDGHNASAAAVEDGRIMAAVAEERLTRRKMQRGFPHQSIPLVLALAGWTPEEVDLVAAAGRYGRLPLRLLDARYSASGLSPGPMTPAQRIFRHVESLVPAIPAVRSMESTASAAVLRSRLRSAGFPQKTPVTLVPHHRAHAYGAAAMLRTDGAVLTMDGYGDGLWATLHRCSGGSLARVTALPYLSSIAVTYGAVCQALGFREGDEGKVTALAASGDPGPLLPLFLAKFGLAKAGSFDSGSLLRGGLPGRRELARLSSTRPEDVAAALQEACERYVLAFLRSRLPEPPPSLALAGGLFANVSINRRVADHLASSDVLVYPPMTDQGLSLGAALAACSPPAPLRPAFTTPFLGDSVSCQDGAGAARSMGLSVATSPRPERRCAEVLAAGGTVALVSGREEFGPRALGNRSLLFAATSLDLADRVQSTLHRSRLMPFAPVCRQERAQSLFLPPWPAPTHEDLGLGYMTFAVRAREDTGTRFPAAVHRDGSARVQVVSRTFNPRLWLVLEQYEALTGLPLLINTSFNLHGEPIVHAADDSLRTFVASGVDLLLLGDLLVRTGGPA